MLELTSVVAHSDAVLGAELDGETVLMMIADGSYLGLSQTSREIWHRISQPVIVGDLCRSLSRGFEAPQAQIEADTLDFLHFLASRGLITVQESCG